MEFEKLQEIIAEVLNVDPEEITMDKTWRCCRIRPVRLGFATPFLKYGER